MGRLGPGRGVSDGKACVSGALVSASAFIAELKRPRDDYYEQLLARGYRPAAAYLIIRRVAGYL